MNEAIAPCRSQYYIYWSLDYMVSDGTCRECHFTTSTAPCICLKGQKIGEGRYRVVGKTLLDIASSTDPQIRLTTLSPTLEIIWSDAR
jgi:hypothetical protein